VDQAWLTLVFPMVAFLLGWVVGWIQGYYPEREKVRDLEKALVMAKELELESSYWKHPTQP
jgi:hypothetical protein